MNWIHYPYDYGRFRWLWLSFGSKRRSAVNSFRDKYEEICDREQVERPSVIAHSFGTYIVASALEQYELIKCDKVIFCGSIVRSNFDWGLIFERRQVNAVRNDHGRLDLWPRVAKRFIRGAGNSGTVGFTCDDPRVVNKAFRLHGHSDYFHPLHFRGYWIPFLELDWAERVERIRVLLADVVKLVSGQLAIVESSLRSNIFFLDNTGILRIFPGLYYNMSRRAGRRELSIQMLPGYGSTGSAYRERAATIAVAGEDWARYDLPADQQMAPHRRLRWIVSMPILDPADALNVIGVLNVDCLGVTKTVDELTPILPDIWPHVQIIARLLSPIVGTVASDARRDSI